ncbi:hypothetical protein P3T37_004880 [Kitasatospora sp. MAA4]|uniref:hypothetical protein n=1 Tax=Kitasatospora sp. MAA4 TaxID=3035093 RepID=UPI0024762D14|nr:hypothetical protein [Kitasatospora sp. MAA4]MDH6135465.1 hypothetical protein [Kitasatospora sp. MAA4]
MDAMVCSVGDLLTLLNEAVRLRLKEIEQKGEEVPDGHSGQRHHHREAAPARRRAA